MPPTYGLTTTGFVAKTSTVILGEIQADQLANVDPTLDLAPDQPLGQFNGIFAAKLAEGWELVQTIYEGLDPDKATNTQLDNASALTGTLRAGAKQSLVTATVGLDASKTFAPGTMTANPTGQPGILWRNRDTVTSVAAGPYPAVFVSADYGPIVANAGTLTVITTPVSGWNTITNALDAVPGQLVEQDTPMRVRRKVELTKPGGCGVDSLRADLLDPAKVPGVIQAVVLENTSMATDGNGLPPKSFCAVIWDGVIPAASDVKIAQTIWNGHPSGIQSYGASSANAVDSTGVVRVVAFSRAPQRTIYLAYTLSRDATKYPVDGDAQLKAAAVALGALLVQGNPVIALKFRAVALTIAGVLDVTSFFLDFTAVPVATANLIVGATEIATFDTSRITVA